MASINPLKNSSIVSAPRRFMAFSAYWVLILSLLLSFASAIFLEWSLKKDGQRRFEVASRQLQARILNRLERYQSILIQTRAHILTTQRLTREDFRRYVEQITLLEKYPGIQGLGYAIRIAPKDLDRHVREVRASGFKSYRVWPETPRKDYTSIVYIEPFDWRNQRAHGYDMSTDPIRREAMLRATDTGYPSISGMVTLVQETPEESELEPQPGFLLYVPIYRGGLTPATVEERRKLIQGFVYAPFRARIFFNSLLRDAQDEMHVDLEVFDGDQPTISKLVYDLDGVPKFHTRPEAGQHQAIEPLELPGRSWTMIIRSTEGFEPPFTRALPWIALILGSLVGTLLFRVVKSAQDHSAREADSRRTLEVINQVGRKISGELELDRLVQEVIDAATQLTKAEGGAFSYVMLDADGDSVRQCVVSGDMSTPTGRASANQTLVPYFRSDDLRTDTRVRERLPFSEGGGKPAASYLSIPVISRSGESLGGLFFRHSEPGKFTEREEEIIVGLAAQVAVALDNAGLFRKAQAAIAARDEFLSICSHELKTPLTSLKLQTQMYRRKLRSGDTASMLPERMEKLTETSERQIERLNRLVEDMLDIARISAGRMAMRPEPVELYGLVAEMIERISPQALAAQCTISLKGPDSTLVGYWDRLRIEQVVANLLSNAIKYGARMPIDVTLGEEDGEAFIRVRDYGIGIDKAHQVKIFERFERAISASNISGLGLGLYIVRQILEAHGGVIEVSSELGQGSTFTVRLPLKSAMVQAGLSSGSSVFDTHAPVQSIER